MPHMAAQLPRLEVQNPAIPVTDISRVPKNLENASSDTIKAEECMLHPQDDEKIEELERKGWFQDAANEKLNIPTGYSKVAVLIVKWHDEIDPFHVGHNEEIGKLKALFEDKFHYECAIVQLHNLKKPQHALGLAMMEHIEKHDGPNNLLIVYYTGHGRIKNRNLELSATAHISRTKGRHQATAYWSEAEALLISESTEADALTILDCCFASNAHYKESVEGRKTYELIAASPKDQPTNAPGPSSFTTALTNSLEELLDQYKDRNFTTAKLQEKICMNRDSRFPAMLYDRLGNDHGHVKLAPLNMENVRKQVSLQSKKPEQSWVKLRFSLEQPKLDQAQIEGFARQLPGACKAANLSVRRIDWIKMESTAESPKTSKFPGLVAFATAKNRMLKRASQSSLSGDSAPRTEENSNRKRQRTDEPAGRLSSEVDCLTPSESGSSSETSISPTNCVESMETHQDE